MKVVHVIEVKYYVLIIYHTVN